MAETYREQDPSLPQKLTNWANEPSILALKRDLEAAKPAHQTQMTKIVEWDNLRNVSGPERPKKIRGRSAIQPKLIRRQAEWRYPSLTEPFLSNYRIFEVKPRTFEDSAAAQQNQVLLNYQFDNQINKVQFIDDFIRGDVDEGTALVQVGWKRYTVKVKETVPEFSHFALETAEQAEALQQALMAKQENRRGYEESVDDAMRAAVDYYEQTGEPTYAVQTGVTEAEVEKIIENRPTLEVLNPHNVIIDPTCNGDLEKALFVIVSFETSRSELLKSGKRYQNLDRVIWDNNSPATHPEHETTTPDTFQFNDRARKKVVAFEYWGFYDIHKDGTLVPFVATWIGNVMIRMELNPYPDQGLPFVMARYSPKKRELYGEPDAELLGDNQRLMGALTRGMVDIMGRSANGQQGMAKGMLDALNQRRYDNGQDYQFNPNFTPAQGLITHTFPEIPQSAMVMLQMQSQEAEALSGVKGFGEGINSTSLGDVAAGIRGVLDASSKREMSILRRLSNAMQQIGKKMIAMNSEFLSEQEVVRITNEEFITVKREDLKGNFDCVVDISTPEQDNTQAQDLGFMLQTIGPNMDFNMTKLILEKIARLKRMPDLANEIKKFQPQPDPLKELEQQKLQSEIQESQAKIAYYQAQAQRAAAEAQATGIEATKNATGQKFAEDIAKQQGQAEGNQDLEVTKALLSKRKEGEGTPDIEGAIGWNSLTRAGLTQPITGQL
ncbi:portal protein [Stenotrophomonas phage Pokken]|uniref:Portal protein n=1 Tax=Stenotrophomonas phage Pokken TaxID=2596674 RepID=A0A5B9N6V5_9CAUD|nr:portal protein [Stenotrophomonas phage Pokken]QEG09299.1 portal protein [Stenotrophomonas phage Pokken]